MRLCSSGSCAWSFWRRRRCGWCVFQGGRRPTRGAKVRDRGPRRQTRAWRAIGFAWVGAAAATFYDMNFAMRPARREMGSQGERLVEGSKCFTSASERQGSGRDGVRESCSREASVRAEQLSAPAPAPVCTHGCIRHSCPRRRAATAWRPSSVPDEAGDARWPRTRCRNAHEAVLTQGECQCRRSTTAEHMVPDPSLS
jgi:hypothetical protein